MRCLLLLNVVNRCFPNIELSCFDEEFGDTERFSVRPAEFSRVVDTESSLSWFHIEIVR